MASIVDFIAQAQQEYVVGAQDHKIRLGEMKPCVDETEDGDQWYLQPIQQTLFQTAAPQFLFSKWSFEQVCKRLKPEDSNMDFRYIRSCGPDLGLQQLGFWFQVHREREAYLRLRIDPTTNRTDIRGILPGLYQPIDAVPVGRHFEKLIGKDKPIEFVITDSRWQLTYWEQLLTQDRHYGIGFRVMGSEVGALANVRLDVMLSFRTSHGMVSLPILIDDQSLCTLPYSGVGATALNRLDLALQRGTQVAESAQTAVQSRKDEPIKYAADEFYEIALLYHLPTEVKGLPLEQPQLFEHIHTKFDLACLLGQIAADASGRNQLRIESVAGMYLLTGRSRPTRNRNTDVEEEDMV